MADKYVRIVGEVTDMDDVRLGVGVDYDTVTIGPHRLDADQVEDFAQLLIGAVWQAGQQKQRMADEASDA